MPDWLHVLLRREGYLMNHKKLLRLHREEKLAVRRRCGRKRAIETKLRCWFLRCRGTLRRLIPIYESIRRHQQERVASDRNVNGGLRNDLTIHRDMLARVRIDQEFRSL